MSVKFILELMKQVKFCFNNISNFELDINNIENKKKKKKKMGFKRIKVSLSHLAFLSLGYSYIIRVILSSNI